MKGLWIWIRFHCKNKNNFPSEIGGFTLLQFIIKPLLKSTNTKKIITVKLSTTFLNSSMKKG